MFAFGVKPDTRNVARSGAHVIVCGNEKGGSGKSTTAMHIAVALAQTGHRVATFDLDGRQLSLTHYVENRMRWARKTGFDLAIPHHMHVPPARRETVSESEAEEFRQLADGLAGVDREFDFVVIDTPGADTFLSRVAHRMADTLITPMNDSFVDLDVLAQVDPIEHAVSSVSQYALAVRDARRERRQADGTVMDWIVMRNRLAPITSRNERKIDACLRSLSMQLGFRLADGVSERTIFREFFPLGLTALDDMSQHAVTKRPSLSHLAARQEIRQLLNALRLPTDESGRRRAAARRAHAQTLSRPIAMPDIFAN
jgi:chromosome partitioning protein